MFQLLPIIFSYQLSLLHLTPSIATGIISTVVLFIFVLGLISYKKIHKTTSPKNNLHSIFGILQMLIGKLSNADQRIIFIVNLFFCLIAAVMTVVFAQIVVNTLIFSMGFLEFCLGVLIVLTVILLLYCLLGKIAHAISIGAGIFMFISSVNAYVYRFRGRLFEPVDIFSASTAMNVAENYSLFPIPLKLLASWCIFITMLIILYYLQYRIKSNLTVKNRFLLLSICVISSVATFSYASELQTYHWSTDGARESGYFLDFIAKFKEISAPEPDNYTPELIVELVNQYATNSQKHEIIPSKQPHIIVIMDEAFSDLSILGKYSTNTEVMPYISSLKENVISGYALTSIYGGNTANSEYEFLTGNSLAWLSPNSVPYQQYIRSSTYSMASYLKSSYNYKCLAMHPFHSNGWNRPNAYKHLGFDECYFIEDFPQKDYIRKFISDQEMFEYLVETYESQKENPLFIFGVTMQNHGDYLYIGENYTKHISLNDYNTEFPDVEQYLSLIYETDKAVEYLITYFQNLDEDVIIVFFGDHQPKLDESFYETINGTAADTLDEQQKRYMVPFFIWTNYNIEEEYIDCTSLNYLSSYVYTVAGITLPPYNQFLQEMESQIPSINANGFYSLINECYLPFADANDEELRWLELYKVLQYNSIFDKKHKNEVLFPILNLK